MSAQMCQETHRRRMTLDPGWEQRAVCTPADDELLFSDSAEDQRLGGQLVCRGRACPVILECLTDAIDRRERFGVRGGTTERKRAIIVGAYVDRTAAA
jgi:WhiB family transcriptional regulator, redox-sensing transcriptional regulator